MLVNLIYIFCVIVVIGYTIFVALNWSAFKSMSAAEKSSFLNNWVQIIFISLGSIVATYSLSISIFDSERQRDIRTSELFEELAPEEISRHTRRYREFASLIFDDSFRSELQEDERLAAVLAYWSGDIEGDFAWTSRAISKILQCGDLGECNERRVNGTICSITDDLIRHLARKPTITIPNEMTNFVYRSRDLMADYQRRSCGFVYSAIDYIDEASLE